MSETVFCKLRLSDAIDHNHIILCKKYNAKEVILRPIQ